MTAATLELHRVRQILSFFRVQAGGSLQGVAIQGDEGDESAGVLRGPRSFPSRITRNRAAAWRDGSNRWPAASQTRPGCGRERA